MNNGNQKKKNFYHNIGLNILILNKVKCYTRILCVLEYVIELHVLKLNVI